MDSQDRVTQACLICLTSISLTFALIYTKPALMPLVFAIFLYYMLKPVLRFFQTRLKLSRVFSLGLSFSIGILIIGLIGLIIANSIDTILASADLYRTRVVDFVDWLTPLLQSKGIPLDSESWRQHINDLPVFSWVSHFTQSLVGILGTSSLVILFLIFLLLGESKTAKPNKLLEEIDSRVTRYVSIKLFISLMTSICSFGALMITRTDLAFMFAILTFFLNFVPTVGSLVAIVLPIPVILLQHGFDWHIIVSLSALATIQFFFGNLLETKMMGQKFGLHPITVMVFLIFWGLVWGLPGMFLATPITAVLQIILARLDNTKPLAELMAGSIR
ncbi:MAG: hypothetical protein COV44_04330 [Deltaproteobacteria bacterium CG11_big_fil_rev_8_21_14_0_20_45_16]|nr:MAG: hypothetical protein COV44_04330 [Deltaproteobacteria bacterium CG11_big_fil_rev_8_21_14_0_20_45_16]